MNNEEKFKNLTKKIHDMKQSKRDLQEGLFSMETSLEQSIEVMSKVNKSLKDLLA